MKGFMSLVKGVGVGEQVFVSGKPADRANLYAMARKAGIKIRLEKVIDGFQMTKVEGSPVKKSDEVRPAVKKRVRRKPREVIEEPVAISSDTSEKVGEVPVESGEVKPDEVPAAVGSDEVIADPGEVPGLTGTAYVEVKLPDVIEDETKPAEVEPEWEGEPEPGLTYDYEDFDTAA